MLTALKAWWNNDAQIAAAVAEKDAQIQAHQAAIDALEREKTQLMTVSRPHGPVTTWVGPHDHV